MNLWHILILLLVAGICGALGQAISGFSRGGCLVSIVLGFIQIIVSVSVNTLITFAAGGIAVFLRTRPFWALVQRWLMATMLAGFAVRMAAEARR